MLQNALKVALSSKAREHHLIVVDAMDFEKPKTKQMASVMNNFKGMLGNMKSILLIMPSGASGLYKSARNLPYIDTIEARNLNPLILLSSAYVVMPRAALETVEAMWANKKS